MHNKDHILSKAKVQGNSSSRRCKAKTLDKAAIESHFLVEWGRLRMYIMILLLSVFLSFISSPGDSLRQKSRREISTIEATFKLLQITVSQNITRQTFFFYYLL